MFYSVQVETIGDAYMVVGGLTDRTGCHEEMVCNQAHDMRSVVAKVKNPIHPGDHIHVGDSKVADCVIFCTNYYRFGWVSTAVR